jgi:hypothetical protein
MYMLFISVIGAWICSAIMLYMIINKEGIYIFTRGYFIIGFIFWTYGTGLMIKEVITRIFR